MSNLHKILIIFVVLVLGYYYFYANNDNIEGFQQECSNVSIDKIAIDKLFNGKKIQCLLDVTNSECNLNESEKYPLTIIKTIDKKYLSVFNDGKLYQNTDIESENLWQGPLSNSEPNENVLLKMVTYDRTGKLLGVGTDGNMYIKASDDILSPWTAIPNSGCVIYVTYDKDGKLLGINQEGRIVKKKSIEITSEWENVNDKFPRTWLKIYWDLNGHMLGIGTDYKLYQRKLSTWEVSDWKQEKSNDKVNDILYDKDGRLYGLVIDDINDMIELRKQNVAYYYSDFYPLDDVNAQGVDMLVDANIIKSKVGVNFDNPFTDGESLNNVVDPSPQELQELHALENQNKLRKLCADKKKKYNEGTFYDFDLQRRMEEQDEMINALKTELDEYSKHDKKYGQMMDPTIMPHDISDLVPSKNAK